VLTSYSHTTHLADLPHGADVCRRMWSRSLNRRLGCHRACETAPTRERPGPIAAYLADTARAGLYDLAGVRSDDDQAATTSVSGGHGDRVL
jgi:hypothetical protein